MCLTDFVVLGKKRTEKKKQKPNKNVTIL